MSVQLLGEWWPGRLRVLKQKYQILQICIIKWASMSYCVFSSRFTDQGHSSCCSYYLSTTSNKFYSALFPMKIQMLLCLLSQHHINSCSCRIQQWYFYRIAQGISSISHLRKPQRAETHRTVFTPAEQHNMWLWSKRLQFYKQTLLESVEEYNSGSLIKITQRNTSNQ